MSFRFEGGQGFGLGLSEVGFAGLRFFSGFRFSGFGSSSCLQAWRNFFRLNRSSNSQQHPSTFGVF